MDLARKLVPLAAALLCACSFDQSGIWFGEEVDAAQGPIDADHGEDRSEMPDSDPTYDSAAEPDANDDPDADQCVTQCLGAGQLLDCEGGGDVVDCDLGCTEVDGAHCKTLSPSNGAVASHLDNVTACLTLLDTQSGEILSDNGEIQVGGSTFRPSGQGVNGSGIGFYTLSASVAILAVDCLTMGAGSRLSITGTRGLIILSRRDVAIRGLVDASGGCSDTSEVHCAGPGGGEGSTGGGAGGCAPGGNGAGGTSGAEAGGGGGGLGQNGADGGDGDAVFRLGGAGGNASGSCPGASLDPLTGGSGGGAGGSDGAAAPGGGGGGALQVSSYTQISITGDSSRAAISAGGAGGAAGSSSNGAGGGGSGGGVLLEAPSISFSYSAIAANGGGGGGGSAGEPGQPGQISTTPALGGQGGAANTAGGAGGAAGATPQEGDGPIDGAGGGGGGYGIIRLNVPVAGLSASNAVFSPAQTRGEPSSQ